MTCDDCGAVVPPPVPELKTHRNAPAPAVKPGAERCDALSRTGRHCDGSPGHDGAHWTTLRDVLAPSPATREHAAEGAGSAHDHGNCELCDEQEREFAALRSALTTANAEVERHYNLLKDLATAGPCGKPGHEKAVYMSDATGTWCRLCKAEALIDTATRALREIEKKAGEYPQLSQAGLARIADAALAEIAPPTNNAQRSASKGEPG